MSTRAQSDWKSYRGFEYRYEVTEEAQTTLYIWAESEEAKSAVRPHWDGLCHRTVVYGSCFSEAELRREIDGWLDSER